MQGRPPARGTTEGRRLRRALVALCATQITSWGVLYYAFPVMLVSVTADTGWSTAQAMAAFSTGAVVNAVSGVVVGRAIDRYGPRRVMTLGSVVGVLAVLAISAAPTLPLFFAAWVLAGLAQAMLLYPPAFVALTRWYGPDRVRALTTLTLVGGLASTVFAPLTALLLDRMEWRGVYVVLALVLAAVTIPMHALFLTPPWPVARRERRAEDTAVAVETRSVLRSGAFVTLTVAMAVGAFGMYSATVNLVPLLTSRGIGTHLAAIALGLCGAGQLLGRLGYASLSRRTTPRVRTAGIVAAGAATIVALGLLPGPAAVLIGVAVVAGGVRGAFTLLQATAVADRWGTRGFGHRNGVFGAPITAVIALAPAGGALLAEALGGFPVAYALMATTTLLAASVIAWNPWTPRRAG